MKSYAYFNLAAFTNSVGSEVNKLSANNHKIRDQIDEDKVASLSRVHCKENYIKVIFKACDDSSL